METAPEGTTSRTMAFSIDGDWLCRIIRDTILSDLPDKAEKILGEVQGLTREEFAGILKGDLTFTSALDAIVPLDEARKASYRSQLAYLLAGRIRLPNRAGWWRPCAAITSLGPEDMRGRAREISDGIFMGRNARRGEITFSDPWGVHVDPREYKDELRALWAMRGQHYAFSGEVAVVQNRRVFAEQGKGLSFLVIFEPCEAPPGWWEVPLDATAAVVAAIEAGRPFDMRGNALMYDKVEDDAFLEDDTRSTEDRVMAGAVDAREAQEERNDAEDAKDEDKWLARELARRTALANLRREILDAAGAKDRRLGWSDWRRFTAEDGQVYAVLRKPFDQFVMHRRAELVGDKTGASTEEVLADWKVPAWQPVSPPGLKLMGDSPTHSDWILTAERALNPRVAPDGEVTGYWEPLFRDKGGWLDPNEFYTKQSSNELVDKAWCSAFYALMNAVEDWYRTGGEDPIDLDVKAHYDKRAVVVVATPLVSPTAQRATILLTAPGVHVIEGVVVCPTPDQEVPKGTICVVPHLGPDYYIPAASTGSGGVIIAGAGGETAHLVTVGRDHDDYPTLLVVQDAVEHFAAGTKVRIDLDAGTVEAL